MLWDLHEVEKNKIENILPVTINGNSLNIISLVFDDESKYLIYGDNSNLHIYPVSLEVVYKKLKAKISNRVIRRNEWEYYIRGDIKFESQKVN
jgi:hypothetical protein